ncbi:hypothetical protein AURDEDRAFT_176843 [Auricularia subglabra TFB-10046 SS5]|uniref:Uncharacterized protein n=1 Tax=Auricularia subglabra (strain TFB-10046 / SS5) TaxID=717982 RepID=J0WNY6_AURST|nr:hypothetical protein AURDEDRAFT_176843 [Auricularia subglabra TFB-10046 SS5]
MAEPAHFEQIHAQSQPAWRSVDPSPPEGLYPAERGAQEATDALAPGVRLCIAGQVTERVADEGHVGTGRLLQYSQTEQEALRVCPPSFDRPQDPVSASEESTITDAEAGSGITTQARTGNGSGITIGGRDPHTETTDERAPSSRARSSSSPLAINVDPDPTRADKGDTSRVSAEFEEQDTGGDSTWEDEPDGTSGDRDLSSTA